MVISDSELDVDVVDVVSVLCDAMRKVTLRMNARMNEWMGANRLVGAVR